MAQTLAITPLGAEVAISDIPNRLREFWKSESESTTRASIMNFVVYSEDDGSLERNTDIVREITAEHACRAILVAAHCASCDSQVQAWITAHCQVSQGGGKSVCSEQIAFDLRGNASRLLRNIVFAHLDSDLPLVFWWQGDLTDTFEERLYSPIDRLIVDSTHWSDPLAQYEKLRAAHTDAGFIMHDMTWTRSHTIRRALAIAFDQNELWRQLDDTTAVDISVEPRFRLSVLFVIAWLSTQLNWKWNGALEFTNANGALVKVTLTESDASSKNFSSFAVSGKDWSVTAARQERSSRYLQLTTKCPAGTERTRLFPAGAVSASQRILDQLARAGQNSLFQKLIPHFCDLLSAQK
jgi:glucose-6-phosphate dehydrogenase assembly protein OpcA